MDSFASQAKEQADYALSLITDQHWRRLITSGVDRDNFGKSLTSVTQADLSIMQDRCYPKGSGQACMDLEFELNSLLPDDDNTAAQEKRANNRKVSVFNKIYGVSFQNSKESTVEPLTDAPRSVHILIWADGLAKQPVSTFPLSFPIGRGPRPASKGAIGPPIFLIRRSSGGRIGTRSMDRCLRPKVKSPLQNLKVMRRRRIPTRQTKCCIKGEPEDAEWTGPPDCWSTRQGAIRAEKWKASLGVA